MFLEAVQARPPVISAKVCLILSMPRSNRITGPLIENNRAVSLECLVVGRVPNVRSMEMTARGVCLRTLSVSNFGLSFSRAYVVRRFGAPVLFDVKAAATPLKVIFVLAAPILVPSNVVESVVDRLGVTLVPAVVVLQRSRTELTLVLDVSTPSLSISAVLVRLRARG